MCTKITGRTKTLLATVATTVVLLFSGVSSAEAFTLLYEDPSDTQKVTGIEDLTIDGTEYDVSFEFGSFNDVFGNTGDLIELEGKTPEFWGNYSGAMKAAQAIIDALGEDSYVSTSLWDELSDEVWVPYQMDYYPDYFRFWADDSGILGWDYLDNFWSDTCYCATIATFNVVDPPPPPQPSDRVPEPSLILGLIGLGGLMLGDKRKTRG
ncbi:PEP-CTERM sorting domain-containing protein [Dapis sp. BLCC M172]|uniref:PEP-CTERM sorting domain-containing protein n=1 Tax=Dapis sp. BLCC M172 TaxID=2975281 RepID=UPI003CFA9CAD